MNVLVVGLSHRSAPVAMLERAVLADGTLVKLLRDACHAEDVAGSAALSTCNRVEIYADVDRFHGGVAAISELLARHSGIPLAELTPCLYVHYADRAVQHLLAVTCGLDSMVVGESQILGQVRQAWRLAAGHGTLSRALADLGALALRTGKRARTETDIDSAGRSLVSVGLALAADRLRRAGPPVADSRSDSPPLAGAATLIVGAGSMSSLAAATAARLGAGPLVIANRTGQHAKRLATAVGGSTARLSGLEVQIAAADLVISCTGAAGRVITAGAVRAALALRQPAGRPIVLLDLALPHDIEADAGQLPGVSLIGLADLAAAGQGAQASGQDAPAGAAGRTRQAGARAGKQDRRGYDEAVAAVRRIVAEELAAQLSADRAALVAPTVVALRAKAAGVVDAEMSRLAGRLPGLDARSQGEIAQAMHRIADKLLHAPTVRVKELAGAGGAESYEAALRVLFDLDPAAVQALTRADARLAGWHDNEAVETS
jgi:glutamyl-tRNA reductase